MCSRFLGILYDVANASYTIRLIPIAGYNSNHRTDMR